MTESVRQGMNPRHRLFAEKYVICGNIADAYMASGFNSKNRTSASAAGTKLLTREDVRAYIQEMQDRRSQRLEITADRVLQEVARLAFATVGDVSEWKDNQLKVKNSEDIDDNWMAAIAEVSETRSRGSSVLSVKMHQKSKALGILMKHLGIDINMNELIARLRTYEYDAVDRRSQGNEDDTEIEDVNIADDLIAVDEDE